MREGGERRLTNLDMTGTIKEDIVTLDITVNDVLAVQMGQSLASIVLKYQLANRNMTPREKKFHEPLRRWWRFGLLESLGCCQLHL